MARNSAPLTKVWASKLNERGTTAGECAGTLQTRMTDALLESRTSVAGTTVEPNETRGALEGRFKGGKPAPAMLMRKPPSLEDRPTVVEDAMGLMSDRLRGLEKEMVYGSGETATSTDSACTCRATPCCSGGHRTCFSQMLIPNKTSLTYCLPITDSRGCYLRVGTHRAKGSFEGMECMVRYECARM
jgi:hypothetical protein